MHSPHYIPVPMSSMSLPPKLKIPWIYSIPHIMLRTSGFPPPQSINTSILAASRHRVMEDDPVSQSQFLEHFVPSGPTDLGISSLSHPSPAPNATSTMGVSMAAAASANEMYSTSPSRAEDTPQARGPHPSASTPLPATFAEICQIPTSTVRRPPPAVIVASGGSWEIPRAGDVGPSSRYIPGTSRALHAESSPTGDKTSTSNDNSAWLAPGSKPTYSAALFGSVSSGMRGHLRRDPRPTRVDPRSFSGNMSACLGDMMDALTVAGATQSSAITAGRVAYRSQSSLAIDTGSSNPISGGTFRSHSSLDISEGNRLSGGSSRRNTSGSGVFPHPKALSFGGFSSGDEFGRVQGGVTDGSREGPPLSSLGGAGSKSGPTSRFSPLPGRSEPRGEGAASPMLGSPALLSKTKLQPIMSSEVISFLNLFSYLSPKTSQSKSIHVSQF